MPRLLWCFCFYLFFFFFFNDTATTEIYTLSLHDALPICIRFCDPVHWHRFSSSTNWLDRKSTRVNSSHRCISYAVFCLKKKKNKKTKLSNQIRDRAEHMTDRNARTS